MTTVQKGVKTNRQVSNSIKHLDWSMLSGIEDIPMENRRFRNHSDAGIAKPFPEHDILGHYSGLELLFRLEVENLDGFALGFEGDNILAPVHDGTVGVDGPSDDLIVIFQIHYNHLCFLFVADFLSYADIVV